MIGSQATKGMHVLARFSPTVKSCDVGTDSQRLYAIEAYPALQEFGGQEYAPLQLDHIDQRDALWR